MQQTSAGYAPMRGKMRVCAALLAALVLYGLAVVLLVLP
jgi:F0F1-type ATP synthase membrane subunit c/vacuolar-type H+-ATPase subunit K